MTFYHIPDNHLPKGAQYYFNVLAISIGVSQKEWEENFPKDTDEVWYTEQLTEPKPRIYHFYIIDDRDDTELLEELFSEEELADIEVEDLDIEILLHQVVEIHPTLGICLYDMLDFDTEDLWRID